MKTIKVYFEIQEDWFDAESPTGWTSMTVRDLVGEKLKETVIKQYLSKITLPKIEIKPEEVKDRILTILAERALEGRNED